MQRTMKIEIDGLILYESAFDMKTGVLVRSVEDMSENWGFGHRPMLQRNHELRQKIEKKYGYGRLPSPSPETVDIAITNQCDFGCSYCYQDSKAGEPHAPKELAWTAIDGFDTPPYQMAIGGGEPTMHPDFIEILEGVRERGTVPNYTTAGHHMTEEIIEATNRLCGGVALTYHAFRGIDYFAQRYARLDESLKCQLNVHLIADKDVAVNLDELIRLQQEWGWRLNLVLLAYYPDVGRASMDRLLTADVYNKLLPGVIQRAMEAGMKVAFSEGLLPYFLSRPDIGVGTDAAMRSEGLFSCYVAPNGGMSKSSFEEPFTRRDQEPKTVFNTRSQEIWEKHLNFWRGGPNGEHCDDCSKKSQCASPHEWHQLTCAYTTHNRRHLNG